MRKLKTVDELYDFIGYVVLCAPDKFPTRDYLKPEDQMNLSRAFEQLREGLELAYPPDYHPEKKGTLSSLLDQSLAAYTSGDRVRGAHILQDFQDGIFKSR